jgi:hypothetical protein
MENLKTILVGGATAVVVVILGFVLVGSQNTVIREVRDSLGAVSSPDIMSPYFSFGGVRMWGTKTQGFNSATTTVCAIQSPAATSSIQLAGASFTVSSTTASTVTISMNSTPYASGTALIAQAVGANAQATVRVASSTVVSPNQYIVTSMSGGTGTFSPSGNCQASFIEL